MKCRGISKARAGQAAALLVMVAMQPLHAETPIAVPSGQAVTFLDTVWTAPGPEGTAIRFRFLAPAIARDGGTVDFDTASADMLWLCETFAIPRIAETGPQPTQIIVSLADKPVPFGEADQTATQFFEAYRREGASCMWEEF